MDSHFVLFLYFPTKPVKMNINFLIRKTFLYAIISEKGDS